MILDTPRPKKRLVGRFIWPLLITAAALVAVAVSSAGRDTRADLVYLDTVQDQAGALATRGDALREVIATLDPFFEEAEGDFRDRGYDVTVPEVAAAG